MPFLGKFSNRESTFGRRPTFDCFYLFRFVEVSCDLGRMREKKGGISTLYKFFLVNPPMSVLSVEV